MDGDIINKQLTILLIFILLFLSIGVSSACDNSTASEKWDFNIQNDNLQICSDGFSEFNDVMGNCDEVIENESIDGITLVKVSDENGEDNLDIDSSTICNTSISSESDDEYYEENLNTNTLDKLAVNIKADNFETYLDSDLFFKVKITDQLNNAPLDNIKVLFTVYHNSKKFKEYTRLTDKKGVATLDKNFKVGKYKVYVSLDGEQYDFNKTKSVLKIKKTAETGCCSFYVQVSKTEGVAGFRRDSTYAADLYIKVSKWHGRTAIKQYKTAHTYFFHSITTSDGWMMGTGGADNPDINKAIENIAGKIVSSGKIKKSYLKKIQGYERSLGIGHFAIKAPNGKYAVVWKGGVKTGKLKAGEYMSVPNSPYNFRQGNYAKFDENPSKAALKIGATDVFGVNRRDITIFHWKSTTNGNYETTSKVKVYAANDDGHMMGRYTSHLKDNIHFKDKYISKNKLPKVPSMKKLGTHKFGNIDKIIKTATTVKAPEVQNTFNKTKYFKIKVKNKNTKKVISGVKIKIVLSSDNFTKTYKIKTDGKGLIKLDTKNLEIGKYDVVISPANNKYLISAKSTIKIINCT